VPPDSVRCTREPQDELRTFGKFSGPARYNSPDCPVYTGQCPVLQGGAAPNSPVSGIRNGCSAIIHRTCPVYTRLSGVTAEQRLLRRQRLPASALNARQRAEVRHAHAGAPDTPQFMSGAPPVIQEGLASELQRSEP
jgi:hypothetical protein